MKKISIIISIFFLALISIIVSSCSSTSLLAEAKSGAQLWGENCLRCHNIPSPETFSDAEWDVAVLHMRVRANLTENESIKIAGFLKSAN